MTTVDGKIVLLGASSVGKTSIVTRAVVGSFELEQQSTVGANYSTKVIVTDTNTTTLRIWDTAGQERYRTLAPMYYQGSQAAIVVFSLTDETSLTEAERWVEELRNHFDEVPRLFLVGNKADLEGDRKVEIERASEVAAALNAEYFETSAKTGSNVTELFDAIADFLQSRGPAETASDQLVPLKPRKGGACGC